MNENMIRMIMSREEQLHLAAKIKAERDRKLQELGHMIRGTPTSYTESRTKGASLIDNNPNPKPKVTIRLRPILSDKQKKLTELGKLIRDH